VSVDISSVVPPAPTEADGELRPETDQEQPALQQRRHRTDYNQLVGCGRVAAPPREFVSKRDNHYVVVRLAQNVRLLGSEVVTNWFDLVCFGGLASVARDLQVGQKVYFWGTFGQVEVKKNDRTIVVNRVIVDHLDPVASVKKEE
jgi:single-stranded DNA-binding protein